MSTNEIRNEIMAGGFLCRDSNDVRCICHIEEGRRLFVDFASKALRNEFLSICCRPVISLNTSYERFLEEFCDADDKTIYSGLKNCDDFNILHILRETNNLII